MRGSSSPSAGSTAPAAAQTFGGSPRSVRCMRSAARRSRPIATATQPSLPWKPTHDEADTDLDPGRRVRGDHGGVAPGTFATPRSTRGNHPDRQGFADLLRAFSDQAHYPLALALQDAKLQGLLSVGIGSFGGDPKKPWPVSDHWKSS